MNYKNLKWASSGLATTILMTLMVGTSFGQPTHHPHQLLEKKKVVSILSPIMMLLDDLEQQPDIDEPGVDVCSVMAEIDAGVYDFGQTPDPAHTDPGKLAEHNAIFEFVNYDRATHVAVNNGRWSDPATWYMSRVPGDCANAIVPQAITVNYDRVLDERLATIRVDGTLKFANHTSSKLVVDTLVVDPRGSLEIGTQSAPIRSDVKVEIVIANNGNIDITRDPMLLSRGVVAHGQTRIHGAKKRSHIKVAFDPQQNSDTITLAEAPAGWRVGDTVIVAGTRYYGWKWDNSIRAVRYFDTEDEVRVITSIMGNTLRLNHALEFSHAAPRADLKTSVANYSRNVVFRSENGDSTPVHQRGHVMFMHTNNVDVRYAEFHQLGRTDKSESSFDLQDINPIQADSNLRGRYSLHLHRIGTADARKPATIIGNAVFGSPGWGYTHHDSHAIFVDNASFDTFGSGFVAETGNETGVWANNIAIKAEGNKAINPKNGNQRAEFDIGRNGVGFWFQGRMVRSIDNVAVSVNNGYAYFHRGSRMLSFPAERFMLPEALDYNSEIQPDDAPILDFDNNEAIACTVGMYVVKANPNQGHDVFTTISNFKGWNLRYGIGMEYTSHYLVENIDLIAATAERFFDPKWGVALGTNTSDMVIKNARIDGFPTGMHLSKKYTDPGAVGHDQYVVIEPTFIDVDDHFSADNSSDQFLSLSDLQLGRFAIQVDQNNGRHEYLNPASNGGSMYTGTKTDSIGDIPIPAGLETFGIFFREMVANLRINGYQTDQASGDKYTIIKNYFSDRATGEIHKFGFKTYLGPEIVSRLGNRFFPFRDAVDRGAINLDSQAPIANDDSAITHSERDVQINLLINDSDPEGDNLKVDGVTQPRNGLVFSDDEQRVTYRPLPSFTGQDSFEYWVTDGNGNFTKAKVSIDVQL